MKNFTLLVASLLLSIGLVQGFASTGGDCGCKDSENAIKNGSFEGTLDYWRKEGKMEWSLSTDYNVCGSKNVILNKSGRMYQDVNVAPGQKVSVSAYGGTHDNSIVHKFKLIFLDNSGNELSEGKAEENMNYKVTSSALKQFNLSAVAPSNAKKVRFVAYSEGNYFKVDVVCMSITTPPPSADCNCVASSALKNASFEDGLNYWNKTGNANFSTSDDYNMCGNKNGLIQNAGSLYQDVAVEPGSAVTASAYGGTHNTSQTHKFKLTFLDANGNVISGDHNKEVDMNYHVTSNALQQFNMSSTAPANAAQVRFTAYSSGDWFKIDAVCLNITPPPATPCTACDQSATVVKNASFENGTADWRSEGHFSAVSKNFACGSKVGVLYGSGVVYQEITLVPGSAVTLSVYAGVSDAGKTNQIGLLFYNSNGQLINGSHNKLTEVNKIATGGLQQYNFSSTAPSGAAKVYVGVTSNGGDFYFDAFCMTVTPPSQCESCSNNRLANGGFENGNANWTSEGNVSITGEAKNCGENGAKIDGSGKIYQDVAFNNQWGNSATLTLWAAKTSDGTQKITLYFLDPSNKELAKVEREVTKVVGNAPAGLEKYTLALAIPAATTKIRVEATSTSGGLLLDQTCLTVTGPPLPVTLSAFNVTKEGSTATLSWSTTSESNSDHFDVHHSQDGKSWTVLATIAAQGESKELVTYSYTHNAPLASNLYRLKMVDADETFAYSSIRSLNFTGEEQMEIYPNPTVDRIKLTSNQTVSNVKIYSVNGSLVLNTRPDAANEVDLRGVAQGTYFVKINDGKTARKIVIVR